MEKRLNEGREIWKLFKRSKTLPPSQKLGTRVSPHEIRVRVNCKREEAERALNFCQVFSDERGDAMLSLFLRSNNNERTFSGLRPIAEAGRLLLVKALEPNTDPVVLYGPYPEMAFIVRCGVVPCGDSEFQLYHRARV